MVVLWSLKLLPAEFGKTEESVQWGHPRQLRGHVGDVMDLCWARDSSHFASCSVDGTCILWTAVGGKFGKVQTFDGHKKMVQGVSIDPLTKYIVTMSSDSTVRGYKNRKLKSNLQFFHKFSLKSREEELVGGNEAQPENPAEDVVMAEESAVKDSMGVDEIKEEQADEEDNTHHQKKSSHRMFLDDVEYLSFFRRLSWSPDGSFFLTPASVFQDLSSLDTTNGGTGTIKTQYAIYGFIKSDLTQPAFMLPGIKSYATCIRFAPNLYKLKGNSTPERPALLDLPYRMIFAVGTND